MGVAAAVVGCEVVDSVGAGVESVDFAEGGALRRATTLGLTLGPKPGFLSIWNLVGDYRESTIEKGRRRCFGEHGPHKAADDKQRLW